MAELSPTMPGNGASSGSLLLGETDGMSPQSPRETVAGPVAAGGVRRDPLQRAHSNKRTPAGHERERKRPDMPSNSIRSGSPWSGRKEQGVAPSHRGACPRSFRPL